MRSESLDDGPLVELGERPDVRRDAAAPRDEPPRVPLAPDERLEPEDRLAPDERLAAEPDDRLAPEEGLAAEPDDRLAPEEGLAAEPDDRLAPEERLAAEPDDRLERVAFGAAEPALRLARPAPLDAAAAFVVFGDAAAFVVFGDAAAFVVFGDAAAFVVFGDAAAFVVFGDAAGAFVCLSLEPEGRDDALDVLLAELRAVVAAWREPPLPVLAFLLGAFWFVCFPAFFVVATRFPFPGLPQRYPMVSTPNTPARDRRVARQGWWPRSRFRVSS